MQGQRCLVTTFTQWPLSNLMFCLHLFQPQVVVVLNPYSHLVGVVVLGEEEGVVARGGGVGRGGISDGVGRGGGSADCCITYAATTHDGYEPGSRRQTSSDAGAGSRYADLSLQVVLSHKACGEWSEEGLGYT